jgi:thiamine-phosphate pyrophosphorylase
MFPAAKIYPITDTRISGLTHAEQVLLLIQGGATVIQLREKHRPPREFFAQAEEAIKVARSHRVSIIINDRVDIALALRADGVHLGQDDMPPQAAREILGARALIGYSTHNRYQAISASTLPIDYLALGPIYATASKADSEPEVGLSGLREVRGAIGNIPLVAIGGITAENVQATLRAGANSVAVISAVLTNPQGIVAALEELTAQTF